MSYEDYSRVATSYDLTRKPIGLPILAGCFATVGRPLAELRILDAGCGTGSYAVEALEWVDCVDGIDISPEMIERARKKAESRQLDADRIRFHLGAIDRPLPFDDASFDCVMVNQVLHHLSDEGSANVARHERAFGELSRVTRAGGALVINTSSHEQLRDAWWYRPFFPDAFERFARRLLPCSLTIEKLSHHGFSHLGSFAPTDALIQGDAYLNFEGPLSQEWRDGDSVFSLATDQELITGCSRIRAMRDAGTLDDYALRQDARRPSIGQITFLAFTKSR